MVETPAPTGGQPNDAEFVRVYDQLRGLARQMMGDQKAGHTLQATALVNEAWFRLRGAEGTLTDAAHYHRLAAVAMRNILIDHARGKGRRRRGGGWDKIALDAVELASTGNADAILAVDEALDQLQVGQPVLAELVRLRFFAGLTMAEAARVLGVSERSAYRDWDYAKVLLLRELRALHP